MSTLFPDEFPDVDEIEAESELVLRDYQQAACDAIDAEWSSGNRCTLAVLATGMGKSVIFTEMAKRVCKAG